MRLVLNKLRKWQYKQELKTTSRFRYVEKYGTIFFHIPKAAGTSVYISLFKTLGGGHMSAQEYLSIYGWAKYNAYFKFTFVRNPYDRLYSAYIFLKDGGMNSNDEKFSKKYICKYKDFKDFVINGLDKVPEIKNWIHFIPQNNFLQIHNTLAVDFIGRFENIEKDYKYVANILGLEGDLNHLNQSDKRNDFMDKYDLDMLTIVNKLYSKDFDFFEYRMKTGIKNEY